MSALKRGGVVGRVVIACCAWLGCASPRAARAPESPALVSEPEPDPECWGTVRDRLAVHGVQEVTAEVTVDGRGHANLVRFLSPGLSPSAEQDLRRACEQCPWRPGITDQGKTAESATRTFTIERPEPRR